MRSREFLQPYRSHPGAGRDHRVIRGARQNFQDIPKRPRRRWRLKVAFQSKTELIVRQREIPVEINGLPQPSLGLSRLSEVLENQSLIEMDLGIQSVTTQQRSPILGRALPIAPIGELAQAIETCLAGLDDRIRVNGRLDRQPDWRRERGHWYRRHFQRYQWRRQFLINSGIGDIRRAEG